MECRACNAANPDGNRFCENCGAGLANKCKSCGYDCSPSAKFCGGCGTALNWAPAPPAPAHPGAVITAPASGWGELKQATVLFADIVSSTEQIARLDPEEAMQRLKPAVLVMCEAVERFGGTVIRTLGDGVMALFGVPKALEGHARLASQAALHMQSVFQNHPEQLAIRVGLHSGLVASDPYASDVGKGGGAHGMTIHLASRVIALAQPGGICLTEACRSLLAPACEVQPLGEQMLKGIAKPTPIFSLTALLPIASSSLGERTWATHFRGRDRQFELLKDSLRRTEEGDTRVVAITAEPGSGKSRLCHEFGKWCREQGIPVCEVGVQLYGHATPLQPVLELLRAFYFGLSESDDAEASRADIAAVLRKLPCSDAEIELVCEFMGLGLAGQQPLLVNPRDRHRQLLHVFWRLVRSDPEASAVLLIEDLHWLDESSEEFIATLVEAVAGTRTFVVLNYRPSYQPAWAKAAHSPPSHLTAPGQSDMDVLVAELVGHAAHFADVRRLIAGRSGGNPFFAEELSRSLLDSGVLDPGSELDLVAIESAMPVTVQAVIAARVDSVGEPEKTLLQMCAIIGKDIPLAVLETVASPLAAVIERGLAGLCGAGLIVQQSSGGRRHFTFRHPLIQEVAYGAQLKVRRQVLHAAVAQSMESYYRSQLDEYAGLIAYHYEAAKRPVEAATHTARAARWVGATDPSRGIKLWYRVRKLLDSEARSPTVDSLRALAGGRIVYLGWREGLGLEEVEGIIEDAVALASQADTRLVQLLLFAHGRLLQSSGGPADGFVASLLKAISMSDGPADEGRSATLNLALSHAYAWAGRLPEGLAANDIALQNLHKIDAFDRDFIGFGVEQWAFGIRVRLLNRMGRFAESEEYLARMSQLSQDASDPLMRQIAHHAIVDLAWCKGDGRRALEHSREVSAIARDHDTSYSKIFALSCLGLAQLTAGHHAEARASLARGLQMMRELQVAVDFEAEFLAGLAEAELGARRYAQAIELGTEAVGVALQRSNRIAQCRALIVQATALASQDPPQAVQAREALAQAEALVALSGASVFADRLAAARSLLHRTPSSDCV